MDGQDKKAEECYEKFYKECEKQYRKWLRKSTRWRHGNNVIGFIGILASTLVAIFPTEVTSSAFPLTGGILTVKTVLSGLAAIISACIALYTPSKQAKAYEQTGDLL